MRKSEERRGGQPGGQRFKSERGEGGGAREEDVTEIDAVHENGLCHPFSNMEKKTKAA